MVKNSLQDLVIIVLNNIHELNERIEYIDNVIELLSNSSIDQYLSFFNTIRDYYIENNKYPDVNYLKTILQIDLPKTNFFTVEIFQTFYSKLLLESASYQAIQALYDNDIAKAKKFLEINQNDEIPHKSLQMEDLKKVYMEYAKTNSGLKTYISQLDEILKVIPSSSLTTIGAGPAQGKALVNDSIIYTPNYPVKIKDLKPNQIVFDHLGRSCKVLGIYPQGKLDVVKVTFSDDTEIKCNLEHLWSVDIFNKKNEFLFSETFTTDKMLEMFNDEFILKISIPDKIRFDPKPVDLDPYSLSVIFFSNYNIGQIPKDIYRHISDKLKITCLTNKQGKRKFLSPYSFKFKNLPDKYMYNSSKIRFEILRGLMDLKGYVENNNYALTIHNRYKSQVLELLQSLGAKIKVVKNNISNKTNILFVLPAKLPKPFRYAQYRQVYCDNIYFYKYITNIELLPEKKDMTCIEVDSRYKLFLTNGFTPTHNTTLALSIFYGNVMHDKNMIYFSWEVSDRDILFNLASRQALEVNIELPAGDMKNKQLTDEQKKFLDPIMDSFVKDKNKGNYAIVTLEHVKNVTPMEVTKIIKYYDNIWRKQRINKALDRINEIVSLINIPEVELINYYNQMLEHPEILNLTTQEVYELLKLPVNKTLFCEYFTLKESLPLIKGVDGIMWDYLQLMKFYQIPGIKDEKERMNFWVRFLHTLSVEMGISVIELSQMSRQQVIKLAKHHIGDISLFSEANEIERSSSIAIQIFTDEAMRLGKNMDLHLVKHRNGMTHIDRLNVYANFGQNKVGDDSYNNLFSIDAYQQNTSQSVDDFTNSLLS